MLVIRPPVFRFKYRFPFSNDALYSSETGRSISEADRFVSESRPAISGAAPSVSGVGLPVSEASLPFQKPLLRFGCVRRFQVFLKAWELPREVRRIFSRLRLNGRSLIRRSADERERQPRLKRRVWTEKQLYFPGSQRFF